MRGLSIADGTLGLLKFASILEAGSYIQLTYIEYKDIQHLVFNVKFLNVDISRSSYLSIPPRYQKFCRR